MSAVYLGMSHPMWVRGLKLSNSHTIMYIVYVAPYVGAWIETLYELADGSEDVVAPYVGAWIETAYDS